jgi:hypothetical protein
MYREMATLYPEAKFVLTLREDVNAWLESVNRGRKLGKGEMWDGWDSYGFQVKDADDAPVDSDEDNEIYLHTYRAHAASVRDFFAAPGREARLLQMVVDDQNENSNWKSLYRFLDLDPSAIDALLLNSSPCDGAEPSPDLVGGWFVHHEQKALRKAKKALLKVLHGLGWLTAAGL